MHADPPLGRRIRRGIESRVAKELRLSRGVCAKGNARPSPILVEHGEHLVAGHERGVTPFHRLACFGKGETDLPQSLQDSRLTHRSPPVFTPNLEMTSQRSEEPRRRLPWARIFSVGSVDGRSRCDPKYLTARALLPGPLRLTFSRERSQSRSSPPNWPSIPSGAPRCPLPPLGSSVGIRDQPNSRRTELLPVPYVPDSGSDGTRRELCPAESSRSP